MPRPALKNVSTASLQAELERRVSKLADLLKIRDRVDKDIAELQSLSTQFGQAAAAEAPVKVVRKYRRRKAKTAKVVVQPVAKKAKRGVFKETGEAMILRWLAQEPLTSAELGEAWKAALRGGTVANELTRLVKLGRLKRAPAPIGVGSVYSVAGGKPAAKTLAKPAAPKPAVKPVAKKGKRTFTCPACKAVFASGPMLGVHYKAEPSHRLK